MPKPSETKLRTFADCDDLFDNVESETILAWINEYAEKEEARKAYHRKYQAKRGAFLKIAQKMLDKDELQLVDRIAKQRANEKVLDVEDLYDELGREDGKS